MKNFALALAAVAGIALATPSFAATSAATASTTTITHAKPKNVQLAQVVVKKRVVRTNRWTGCRTVTTRTKVGNRVIVRKVRRCR